MPVQKRIIYNIQRRSLRHADRERDEPPLQARVDEEGARARVHAGDDLRLADGLDLRGNEVPSREARRRSQSHVDGVTAVWHRVDAIDALQVEKLKETSTLSHGPDSELI